MKGMKPRLTLTLDVAGWKLTLSAKVDRDTSVTTLAARTERRPPLRTGFRSVRVEGAQQAGEPT